ncbi:MAG TPA: hypothetical protein VJA86_03720 [Candidatus Nanoarchaeia archaeon]|nr:hypothetical protein [Candidatus Nanoarchaeia archaeon]
MEENKGRKQRSALKISSLTREQILNDYCDVQEQISEILNGKSLNVGVADSDYLSPTLYGTLVPLGEVSGRFQYFVKIRAALESVLVTGRISAAQMPDRAPKYLEAFFKR